MNKKRFRGHGLGGSIANISFAMMRRYVRSIQRSGVAMIHTARSFSYYQKVFFRNQSKATILENLQGKRIVDIGCGYTPYARDSMFRACHDAGVEFYGVDPVLGTGIKLGSKERAVAIATGGSGDFDRNAPGLSRALAVRADDLPFEDETVDQILCSYLMFVWIEDEEDLADIITEFRRVLKPGGVVKLYPLWEWRFMRFKSQRLISLLDQFKIDQFFVHGGSDMRVTPSMLTELKKS